METRAYHDETSAPAAAAYPRWILLQDFMGCDDPDARTVAHARTSKGRPISVSFVLAVPPAVSGLRLHSPGLPDRVTISSLAIAAHRDSVLINIQTKSDGWDDDDMFASDYFIYCAGDAAAEPSRPPSLSLLPPFYLTKQGEGKPKDRLYMDNNGTALLRSGQDEVLVAELCIMNGEESSGPVEAELFLLRSGGDWQWDLKRLPVIHDECKREEVSFWSTESVIPVGDRFLLWVDYFRGIIYSDAWDETTKLCYLSLPVEPVTRRSIDDGGSSYRSVCATDGGRAVRFVEVFPRCCCGCPCATACAVSRYAFTITTWTLRMDDMTTWEWDKVAVIDCDELWSIPGYYGVVPRIKPEYPTVSLDDPDVLCFMVRKNMYQMGVDGDLGTRLIELDTRRMELRSICYYDNEFYVCPPFFASTVSQYFNASSCSRNPTRRKDTDLQALARPPKSTFPKVASPEEMLATLREIPNLPRDDMVKAYDVFVWDKSHLKFRSLLALPMDMRKDYCLLIGKLSCFDA